MCVCSKINRNQVLSRLCGNVECQERGTYNMVPPIKKNPIALEHKFLNEDETDIVIYTFRHEDSLSSFLFDYNKMEMKMSPQLNHLLADKQYYTP